MNARSLSILSALLLGGCSLLFGVDDYDVATQSDASATDAGATDAGSDDAGSNDAGAPLDAGEPDAGTPDSGPEELPDLTIGCGTPAEITKGGDVVRVPWTVGNVGMVPGGPLTVAVLMERPAMADDEVDEYVEVGTARIPTRVGLSGSETGEVAFTAPDWVLGGENAIRCVVDSLDEVPELDETNNSADAFLVATGLPDLVPSSIFVTEVRRMGGQRRTAVIRSSVRNEGATGARDVGIRVNVLFDIGGGGGNCNGESAAIPYIAPGAVGSKVVEVSWDNDYDCYGHPANVIYVSVDGSNEIPEQDETNNTRRLDFDGS